MAHDDRRTFQALDHLAEMIERFGDGRLGDDLRLFTQRLHLDLESRITSARRLVPDGSGETSTATRDVASELVFLTRA